MFVQISEYSREPLQNVTSAVLIYVGNISSEFSPVDTRLINRTWSLILITAHSRWKGTVRFSDRCFFDELRRGRFLASEKSTMVIDLNDLEAITKPPSSLFAASSKNDEREIVVLVLVHSESPISRLVTQRCTRTSSSVNLSSAADGRCCRSCSRSDHLPIKPRPRTCRSSVPVTFISIIEHVTTRLHGCTIDGRSRF